MNNTDPATATAPQRRNKFQSLARLSWLTIFLSIGANIFIGGFAATYPSQASHYVSRVVSCACLLVGVLSGIIALFGIRRHGRKGILWPALIGIGLWVGLTWLAWSTFTRLQQMSSKLPRQVLAPAIHQSNAQRVQDVEAGYSFDLPEGYEAIASSALPTKYRQGFVQKLPDEPNRMLLVSRLSGLLSHARLRAGDLPADAHGLTLTTFHWRGLEVNALRVLESSADTRYLTFNVQLPLRQGGVQLDVGGSEESEPSLRALTEQILSTLDGETNW